MPAENAPAEKPKVTERTVWFFANRRRWREIKREAALAQQQDAMKFRRVLSSERAAGPIGPRAQTAFAQEARKLVAQKGATEAAKSFAVNVSLHI